jgi:hypothetical protein
VKIQLAIHAKSERDGGHLFRVLENGARERGYTPAALIEVQYDPPPAHPFAEAVKLLREQQVRVRADAEATVAALQKEIDALLCLERHYAQGCACVVRAINEIDGDQRRSLPRPQAYYDIVRVDHDTVWMLDGDGPISITNDAEQIVERLHRQYGNRRIVYRDTDGEWRELRHRNGIFLGFAPAQEITW